MQAAIPLFHAKATYRKQRTCHCNAYSFPHRAGSGSCEDPGEQPRDCGACGYRDSTNDPFGTGDFWYATGECEAPNGCPWK